MMKLVSTLTLSASVFFLVACNNDTASKSQSDAEQAADSLAQHVCKIDQNFDFSACKTGQRLFFSPTQFGNEQLPIIIISYFCDIHQPVYFNKGGVVCIYRKTPSAEAN